MCVTLSFAEVNALEALEFLRLYDKHALLKDTQCDDIDYGVGLTKTIFCTRCRKNKPEKHFSPSSIRQYKYWCKQCTRMDYRKRREDDVIRIKANVYQYMRRKGLKKEASNLTYDHIRVAILHLNKEEISTRELAINILKHN